MNYKMVVLDMDGTLLNSQSQVCNVAEDVLKESVKRGIIVAIATGRIFTSARAYAELLGIEAPIIACNGALIRNHITNEVIYQNEVKKEDALKVIEICQEHDVYFHFYDQENLYVEKERVDYLLEHYWGGRRKKGSENIQFQELENALAYVAGNDVEILKFVLVDHRPERLVKIRKVLENIPTIEVDKSWHNNLEVMNQGVSKGKAIKQLGEILGIEKDDIIAFGDNYNDLSMKDYSGAFVAMGNSDDAIKEIATYVTTSNDENGVAEGIKKYVW
ncbi:Cof-type HAD-IIB family hydrolase [Alkaliphilus hydrothermalis]|uniref:Cof subfamily protein (Haloacid dehalogenase superfamily) n=1 Tax=Alkaliphilus hydrothermalis TaxID=1482730 RepID=A0ABS2NN76_9FIRM|nr:Cof-type HAD-IIB family hydrolase [Alkaliphilus hydrothermalis]MBM7614405.1 Cof subfamily protein (haloacid dehalogenase superfamily) [Alkaliphilus hydrothermalis]